MAVLLQETQRSGKRKEVEAEKNQRKAEERNKEKKNFYPKVATQAVDNAVKAGLGISSDSSR